MTVVSRWTGREVRILREAMRSTRETFAAMVPITFRQLSTWEARGESMRIKAVNQAALDTILARAGVAVQQRFAAMITEQAAAEHDEHAEELLRRDPRTTRHPVDNKIMTLVEAGIFLSGPDNVPSWLDAFRIDVYPTTNADYEKFVQNAGHRPPRHWPGGRCPASLNDHPVVWVTWDDAMAYAGWCGKALPSVHQWEKAARGSRGRNYPWGDVPTAAKCNTAESGIGATTPVTRYRSGASPYGVHDLCGNVWEWCSTEEAPGRNRRHLRGSAFTSPFERAMPSLPNTADASMLDNDTGFRCVTPVSGDSNERCVLREVAP
ncbi:formylglycine-generating enzyme family protein [Streptomyces murinus]|uniref:formylglycine-generating enzyme family protein n=1 Tax=Streptomyces murinus TaxID=33900 RepID=UPI003815561C